MIILLEVSVFISFGILQVQCSLLVSSNVITYLQTYTYLRHYLERYITFLTLTKNVRRRPYGMIYQTYVCVHMKNQKITTTMMNSKETVASASNHLPDTINPNQSLLLVLSYHNYKTVKKKEQKTSRYIRF